MNYALAAVVGLYVLAVVLYAIPVVSGVLDDTMGGRSRDLTKSSHFATAGSASTSSATFDPACKNARILRTACRKR